MDFDSLDDSVVKNLTHLCIGFQGTQGNFNVFIIILNHCFFFFNLVYVSYKNFNKKLSTLLEKATNLEKFNIYSSNVQNHVLLKLSDKCRNLKIDDCRALEKGTFPMVSFEKK